MWLRATKKEFLVFFMFKHYHWDFFPFPLCLSSCWAVSLEEVLIAWQAKIVDNRANSYSIHAASWTVANKANMEPVYGNIWSFQCNEVLLVAFLYRLLYHFSPLVMSYTVEMQIHPFCPGFPFFPTLFSELFSDDPSLQ